MQAIPILDNKLLMHMHVNACKIISYQSINACWMINQQQTARTSITEQVIKSASVQHHGCNGLLRSPRPLQQALLQHRLSFLPAFQRSAAVCGAGQNPTGQRSRGQVQVQTLVIHDTSNWDNSWLVSCCIPKVVSDHCIHFQMASFWSN